MWLRLYNVLGYSLSLYVFIGGWAVKIMIPTKRLSENIIDLIRRETGFVTCFDAAATFERYVKPCGQGSALFFHYNFSRWIQVDFVNDHLRP